MRITVTGGSGFIGAATVRALEGHEVAVFDHSLGHDVRDPDDCDQAIEGADAVIHLAGVLGTAELFDQVQRAISVNVAGTANVLDSCKRYGAAYVGITMPPVFPSVYTATKVAAQRLAESYHHNFGVPVTHIRAFNAYGPGQAYGPTHPQKIVPTFASRSWRGEPMPIWGDGMQAVDLVHVDHVAKCLAAAALADRGYFGLGNGETFDAGSGSQHTVLDVAHAVARITGCGLVEFLPMRAGEIAQPNLVATEPGPMDFDRAAFGISGGCDPRFVDAVESYAPARVEAAA